MIWISNNNHKADEQEISIRYLRVIQHRYGNSTVCRRFSCGNYDKLCNLGFSTSFCMFTLGSQPKCRLSFYSGWIQAPPVFRIKLVSSIMVYPAIYIYMSHVWYVQWYKYHLTLVSSYINTLFPMFHGSHIFPGLKFLDHVTNDHKRHERGPPVAWAGHIRQGRSFTCKCWGQSHSGALKSETTP